jgi:hypothetical protein
MLPVLMAYEAKTARQGFDYVLQYPREEVLFCNAALEAGILPEGRPPYIDMPWHRNLSWDLETVRATLADDALAPSKFGIKRVARDIDDPVRALVGEHFGYRRLLQAAIGGALDGR